MDKPSSPRIAVTAATMACILVLAPATGHAQTAPSPPLPPPPAFAADAIGQAQRMRVFPDPPATAASQSIPPVIAALTAATDPAGTAGTLQPGGATTTGDNAFFQPLGTNGRSCATCHDPQTGWTVNLPGIHARFQASRGTDPLFRLVDGATCPTAPVSTPTTLLRAYALLLGRGLFRVGLPVPAAAQFAVTAVDDPYGCSAQPATGLTSPTAGILSVYRRPLPTTNLRFLTGIMWDGREPSLASQAVDATLIHAQADATPTGAQQAQMTGFESGLYTAQAADTAAGALNAAAAAGGVEVLAQQPFAPGINDPANPGLFDRAAFKLYPAWLTLAGADPATRARQSIARGERIFNTRPFTISGVAGLNGAGSPGLRGSCSTCHNTPNVGNHSTNAMMDIGVTAANPPGLDVAGLPVFTLTCTAGPLAGRSVAVTDPGRALITGQCADIGKTKVPALRALATRAPYFHNGAAAGLPSVIEFYNRRFAIGLTPQEREDLVNFLQAL